MRLYITPILDQLAQELRQEGNDIHIDDVRMEVSEIIEQEEAFDLEEEVGRLSLYVLAVMKIDTYVNAFLQQGILDPRLTQEKIYFLAELYQKGNLEDFIKSVTPGGILRIDFDILPFIPSLERAKLSMRYSTFLELFGIEKLNRLNEEDAENFFDWIADLWENMDYDTYIDMGVYFLDNLLQIGSDTDFNKLHYVFLYLINESKCSDIYAFMSKPISVYSFEDIKNLFNPDGKNIHPFHTLYENFDTQSISLMHERQIETTLIFEDGSSKKVDYMYVEILEFFVDSHTDTHEIISPKAFERLQVLESILQDISSTEETDGEERLCRFMTRMVKELEKLGILHDEYEKGKDEDDGTYIDE